MCSKVRQAAALAALESRIAAPVVSAAARVQAYLELGKAYDLAGRRSDAQACYRRILALSDDWFYREQARRLFRRPYRGG
jgi:tetratricopeptide (TPR) repeat protein